MEFIPALLLLIVLLVREHTFQQERRDNLRQTQELLQRIQAPSVAVMEHADMTPSDVGLPLTTDEDYADLVA